MTDITTFESALKAVVQAKRLSASKMTALTADAMKLLEHDTQLVSILYRTHKSLSGSSKISSLYVFDSFARAARSKANKQGSAGSSSTGGNAHSFLTKLAGVLDGLFHDMVTSGVPEGKTPPNAPLALSVQANAAITHTPPAQATPATAAADAQAALLALLTQAAAAKQSPPTQTPANNTSPQLDPAQLALLQQLGQLGKSTPNNNTQPPPTAPTSFHQPQPGYNTPNGAYPYPSTSQSPPYEGAGGSYGRRDYRQDRPRSPDNGRPYEDYSHDDRGGGRGRGFRGGFRGRGRGEGRGNRWDDRSKPRDWHAQRRTSRSRSPPSRYAAGRRDVKPYSPPHRPSLAAARSPTPARTRDPRLAAAPESGKDEFGRDIRSPTPVPASATTAASSQDEMPGVEAAPSVPTPAPMPISTSMTVPMSPSVPANIPSAAAPAQAQAQAPLPTTAAGGIETFDPTTFDFTAPASWQALGLLWQTTYGVMPSTEELMQFVMAQMQQQWGAAGGMGMGAMGMGQGAMGMNMGIEQGAMGTMGVGQDAAGQGMGMGMGAGVGRGGGMGGWRGGARGGRGGFRGRGTFAGNGRGGFTHSAAHSTDAIVLGGDASPPQAPAAMMGGAPAAAATSGGGPGGRMQKVGDKWMFVRQSAAA
ncbi:hypothetical protein HDZ31DRAFT_60878 [Schizophyllum fasciatum]